MRNTALVRSTPTPLPSKTDGGFSLDGLRVFTSIPPDHDVIALQGSVAIYDTSLMYREEMLEGSFYVIETQRTVSHMPWENWLRLEVQANFLEPRHQPQSPLKVSREVIQLVKWHRDPDLWAHRLVGGFRDGPLKMWGASRGMIGKVVGLYRPN